MSTTVWMRHPDLADAAEVPASAVPIWGAAGWVPVDALADAVDVPDDEPPPDSLAAEDAPETGGPAPRRRSTRRES
ncbi:hypothetical protein [Actinomadura rupiterrae]|uniref:hypothetical protein n=1 Tax=Actinomadura rupiterrae TaxID=559627 RepID=UPI0020A4EFCB|nr:hypothetical protein [Actinomadura rupiterrae]MCP2339163.1 hypothetical protein [Actinomadura rupiterrae]